MTRGYKTSTTAVCGCFVGDCVLIAFGVFFAKQAIMSIPMSILTISGFVAVIFLLYLSVKFWTINVDNLNIKSFDKKNGLSLALVLFTLKMSSPISIIGYGVIFTQIINNSHRMLASYLGGCSASFVVNVIMVAVFGTIGKKINIRLLNVINKISSLCIGFFAISIAVATIKKILN